MSQTFEASSNRVVHPRRRARWLCATALLLAGFAGCSPTRNPEFCCTSPEDCESLGVGGDLRDCDDGFTCHADVHTCIPRTCGDGVIDRDELCDDGNNADGDGCSARCDEAECFVPVTHPTIQAAVMDARCGSVTVYAGSYLENITIDRDVSVLGVGAAPVVIDGQARGSVVTIESGAVSIENIRITNGLAPKGGGVANHGALSLREVQVEANTARSAAAQGGGVYSDGPSLVLEATTVAGNHAVPDISGPSPLAAGGGIYNAAGSVTIARSLIESNDIRPLGATPGVVATGAGLASESGAVSIVDSAVRSNAIEIDGHPGNAKGYGGGIHLASGSLTLTRANVIANAITSYGDIPQSLGGGVLASRVAVIDTHIEDNSVRAFGDVNCNTGCTARGGGLYLTGNGDSTVSRSSVLRNSVALTAAIEGAHIFGGGVMLEGIGSLSVDRTIISNNTVTATGIEITARGGGLYWSPDQVGASGMLTVTRSTIAANKLTSYFGDGGGIGSDMTSAGHEIRLSQSTINGNVLDTIEGGSGGGVFLEARHPNGRNTLSITSSTISGDIIKTTLANVTASGAGIAVRNTIPNGVLFQLSSSTVTGNGTQVAQSGTGGLDLAGPIFSAVKNTIISGNAGPSSSPDCRPGFGSVGFNLLGSAAGCMIAGAGNDKVGAAAMLAALTDNGGPTLTHALLVGSAALDSGDLAGCTDANGLLLVEDQRGMPRIANGRCDIGAYER